MLRAQTHRGPDDEGSQMLDVCGMAVGLGNRRLAIQDISPLGHQPMTNPETGDVLVYNGEIYNFMEIRRILEAAGASFRGLSDTEVVLRAYQYWGHECLKHLSGMFAFALWDLRRQRLLLARDHLGIKPLYYCVLPVRGIVCASEVRAVLASGLVSLTIDRRGLASYLAYGAVQEPLTIAQGIAALPPGSWAEYRASGELTSEAVYWEMPWPCSESRDTAVEELMQQGRHLLTRAVKRHLVSDVPTGIFLSSGLDSTAIVGFARSVASERVRAFTVTFPENQEYDEGPTARETARRLGVVHHECPVRGATARQWVQCGLESMDQPAADGMNTYIVARAVREAGLVVAVSGQGGDEVFAGYPSFREVPRWHKAMKLLRPLGQNLRATLARCAAIRLGTVARQKLQDIGRTGAALPDLYFHYRRFLSNYDLTRMGISASALDLLNTFHVPSVDMRLYHVTDDPVATVGRFEASFYLRNTLLRDGDVFGMANSLEIRVPFLDRDVVEWAFRLPGHVMLPRKAPLKHLLRKMCVDLYTGAQVRQPKRGFTLPFAVWMLGPLREI